MKKIFLTAVTFLMCAGIAQAQTDTMYVMKAGVVINKQSIKLADVDSIIFYKPANGTVPKSGVVVTPIGNIEVANIPAGTFMMGSPENEVGRNVDEAQYQVTLSSFRMSKYEITNAQFAAFLNAKGVGSDGVWSTAPVYKTQKLISQSWSGYDWGLHYGGRWTPVAGCENSPVINVTWFGAMEFASYIGGKLPTEAQWEYACRAGSTTPFNNGVFLTNMQANYNWSVPYNGGVNTITTYPGKPHAVGVYAPNAWGLYDMHGNVYELCYDWYRIYPTVNQNNPIGSAIGLGPICRGGSWLSQAQDCRSAHRIYINQNDGSLTIGFRVVFVSGLP